MTKLGALGGLLVSCMQCFPHLQTPLHSLFVKVYQQASETGRFTTRRADYGAPWQCSTPEFEEAVLHAVEKDVMTSIRNIAGRLNVNHQTVWCDLHEQKLHPYHPQKVQAMQSQVFASQAHFCRWFLHHCVEEPDFQGRSFSLMKPRSPGKLFSIHATSHIWAEENLHAAQPHGFQERYSLNIWAGFLDGCLIGPYLLPLNLTGATYLRFLEGVLHGLLEDVPLHLRGFNTMVYHLIFHLPSEIIWTNDLGNSG